MNKTRTRSTFLKPYTSLTEVLKDHELASLGDSYTNFIYSLALSQKTRKPTGTKVKGSILAEALRKADLRKHLPSRMTKHALADAAEALMIYGWLQNYTTITESITTIQKAKDPAEGLSQLLTTIKNRITFP